MTAYERFSSFYDAVMDDPGPRADQVTAWIDRHLPGASSLLELGCGTGSILARIPSVLALTGLDRSPEMLAVARDKVPGARLVEADMTDFSLEETFDVIVCVFDSLNHLLTFGDWQSMFDAVHQHLRDDGLFIFDVNTLGELRRLGEEPPWVYDFDEGVAIIDVTFAEDGMSEGLSLWDIRIFEQAGEDRYTLHQEQIGELAVPLALIKSTLEGNFVLLEEINENGETPTDNSVKGHFCYRLAGPGRR
ncbi:MAG TPA: class I SAM-dependent methyltransferase [Acidimicrobiales bacterium]|jgi:SAM-dependent methyltransferase|nr:class I SAM-dependent methyltransferase [Acidimicrobiales bacterium]